MPNPFGKHLAVEETLESGNPFGENKADTGNPFGKQLSSQEPQSQQQPANVSPLDKYAVKKEPQGRLSSAGGSFMRGFGSIVASLPKAIGEGAVALANKFGDDPIWGNPEGLTPEDTASYKAGNTIERWFNRFAVNPEYNEEFTSQLASGAGSMAGFLAGGFAGRAAKIPALATTMGLGAAATGVEGVDDYLATLSKDEQADPEMRENAFALNAALGTSEGLPVSRILNRLDTMSGGGVKAILKEGVKGGLEELTQEVLQSVGQNAIASELIEYDKNRNLFTGTVEAGEVGFTLGFLLNTLAASIGSRRARRGAEPAAEEGEIELPDIDPAAEQPIDAIGDVIELPDITAEDIEQAPPAAETAEGTQDQTGPAPGVGGEELAAEPITEEIEPVPQINYFDNRLKRDIYRNRLQNVADELVEGGGIALVPDLNFVGGESDVRDAQGRPQAPMVRTPSLNPEWFQNLMSDSNYSMSVKKVQNAVTKAIAGDRLGVRQARVIGAMLDNIHGERMDSLAYAREQLNIAREARAKAQLPVADDWLFEEQEYPDDFDGLSRTFTELHDQAKNMDAALAGEVEALMESQMDDAAVLDAITKKFEEYNGRKITTSTEAYTQPEGAAEIPSAGQQPIAGIPAAEGIPAGIPAGDQLARREPIPVEEGLVEAPAIPPAAAPVEVPAAKKAPGKKPKKPRLAENADDLYKAIVEKTDSGVVTDRGILYPVADAIGVGRFRVSSKGIEVVENKGVTVRDATNAEQAEFHDSLEKDQVQVLVMSHWGGSGRDTGSKPVEILHSASGLAFGAIKPKLPEDTAIKGMGELERLQFYRDDLKAVTDKHKGENVYQSYVHDKDIDRLTARIATDYFSELHPATQQWLEFQAHYTDLETGESGNGLLDGTVRGSHVYELDLSIDNLMTDEIEAAKVVKPSPKKKVPGKKQAKAKVPRETIKAQPSEGVTPEEKTFLTQERRKKKQPGRKVERRLKGREERRKAWAYRKDVEEMTEAERKAAIEELRHDAMINELTGLGSRLAWEQIEKKAFIAAIDADSLKYVNDTLGNKAGDELLVKIGKALKAEFGKDAYHISGDEFWVHSDSMDDLVISLGAVQDQLKAETATGPGGTITGLGFSYGVAETENVADREMKADKKTRQKEGLRVERGERPAGVMLKGEVAEKVKKPEVQGELVGKVKKPEGKKAIAKVEQLFVEFEGKRYPVESYEDASKKFRQVVETTGIGSRELSENPKVLDSDENQIGHISYNGRVWSGKSQDWKPGMKPLYSAEKKTDLAGKVDEEAQAKKDAEVAAKKEQSKKEEKAEKYAGPPDLLTGGELEPDLFAPSKKETKKAVDEAAHEAATSPKNGKPEPTEAQKEYGNYKKGVIDSSVLPWLKGLKIMIENPAGSKRRPEWKALANHYGYFQSTDAYDADEVDVFLGPDLAQEPELVHVVDQVHPDTGKPDEHKVMLGFKDEAAAKSAYMANYQKGWKGFSRIQSYPYADFKDKLTSGFFKNSTPARKLQKQPVKAKKPAKRAKPEEKYTEYNGLNISYEVETEDTGETFTVTVDAGVAMREVDTRLIALKALRDCL